MATTSKGPMWLTGERVALGPLRRDLLEEYWEWEQDPRSLAGYGRQTPESLEARAEGLDSQLRHLDQQVRFTVHDLTSGTPVPVGLSTLRIDHYVRTAEFMLLIGAPGRGRGIATEATHLTVDYGFHISQLRSIWLKVLEHNAAAIRAYKAAGFAECGRLRSAGYWLGHDCAEILMDVISDDFTGPSLVTAAVNPSPIP